MDGLRPRHSVLPRKRSRIVRIIRNDGSQDFAVDLLVEAGSVGIVRSYDILQNRQILSGIYSNAKSVTEYEIAKIDAELVWVPASFRSLDKAKLTCSYVCLAGTNSQQHT